MRTAAILTLACGLAVATPASAKNVIADVDPIARIMKSAGYSVEIKNNEAERYIRAQRGKNSYGFSVLMYGCDEGTMNNCKSVQFYSGFTPKKAVTLEAVNSFAQETRWGRYYIDKVGDPVIEMDVDLEKGGMSEALFLDNVEYFEAVMEKFADFVFKE